jgi:hypothetical protein
MRFIDTYIQNDCKRFDKETMKMDEYFLNGKIEGKEPELENHPQHVGKTEGIQQSKSPQKSVKSSPKKSPRKSTQKSPQKSKTGRQSMNYSRIILAENEFSEKTDKDSENNIIGLNKVEESEFDKRIQSSVVYVDSRHNLSNRNTELATAIIPTNEDYEELTTAEQLIYDKREFAIYLKDVIFEEHRIINIVLKKSITYPLFIKLNELIFEISMGLAINALLYSADYIDKRATANDKVRPI